MDKLEIAKAIKANRYVCGSILAFNCGDCHFIKSSCDHEDTAFRHLVDAYIAEHEEKPMYEKVAIEGKPDWCELGVRVTTETGNGYIKGFDPLDKEYPFRIRLDNGRDCCSSKVFPVTKWHTKEGEAVMVWEDCSKYCMVVAFADKYKDNSTHIAKYDGRLDLRVSEIGPEVPRIK